MNGAEFNLLLLILFGVAALIGKAVYERLMTRSEERRSRDADQKDPARRSGLAHRP